MSQSTNMHDESLRRCLIVSACLHMAGLAFLYFGLPFVSKYKPLPAFYRQIPIDIVDIGVITNTNTGKESGTEGAVPQPPQPKGQQLPAESKPTPKAEVKPTVEPKADDTTFLPKPMTKPKPPETPKPTMQQAQQDQLSSVLKNVARLKSGSGTSDVKFDPNKIASDIKGVNADAKGLGNQGGFGPVLSDRLTISAEDALRRQISQCWNIPAGARNAEKLIVEVLIEVNPDRTVREARVVDQMRLGSDPFFRAAAESALRALRNPKCSPLELPPDQYDQWKTITFTFDPRDML